jgi:predicted peptidase
MKSLTAALVCLCVVSVVGQSAPTGPAIVSATVVADALPVGFRVSAIAVEYSEQLGSATIPVSAFTVEALGTKESTVQAGPRTITRAYTNDRAAAAKRAAPGQYVILELAPADKNGVGRSNAAILTLQDSHSVRQVAPMTVNRRTIAANAAPVTNTGIARPIVDDFAADTYIDANGVSLDYRLFTPAGAKAGQNNRRFPLVFALHGMGSSGTDNIRQVVGESMVVPFAMPERQAKTPAFVLAPQRKPTMARGWTAPETQEALVNLLKKTIATLPIDPDRVYLIGLSMGSNGGWTLLKQHHRLFAASIQTAGYGVVEADVLANLRDFPLWVSHGEDDTLVRYDTENSPFRAMNALNAAGTTVVYNEAAANLPVAEANAKALALLDEAKRKGAKHLFTTYMAGTNPVFGHGSWIPLFMTPAVLDWLFAQERH